MTLKNTLKVAEMGIRQNQIIQRKRLTVYTNAEYKLHFSKHNQAHSPEPVWMREKGDKAVFYIITGMLGVSSVLAVYDTYLYLKGVFIFILI